jgi:hypothetical protein
MAALSIAATWNKVELGGIISVGGPMPNHFSVPDKPNVSTPVLVMGGELGDVNATASECIKNTMCHSDVQLEPGVGDTLPASTNRNNSILNLKEFLAHRLRKTEWVQPSVLTLGKALKACSSFL